MKLTQITPYNITQQSNKALNNNQNPSFTSKVVFDERAVKSCESALGFIGFEPHQAKNVLKGLKEALEKATESAKIGGIMNFSGINWDSFFKLSYTLDKGEVLHPNPTSHMDSESVLSMMPDVANRLSPFSQNVKKFVNDFATILNDNGLNGNENPFSTLANKLNKES